MRFPLILLILAMCLLLPHITAVFRIIKINCESHNETLVVFHQCQLRPIKRGLSILNLNFTFVQLAKRLYMRLETYKKLDWYKPSLYNISFNACEFFKNRRNPLFNIIYSAFRDYSTFNHTCPYEGNQFVKGFDLKESDLQTLPLQNGDYGLFFTVTMNGGRAFILKVFFEYKRDDFIRFT